MRRDIGGVRAVKAYSEATGFPAYTTSPGWLGYDDEKLRRVWQYGIYPFIEDQLYGREDVLATFTWDAVEARHGEAARAEAASDSATARDGG